MKLSNWKLMMRSAVAMIMCFCVGALAAHAQSSTIQLSQRILQPAGETAEHDSFGSAVAVGGNTMVIGAFNGDGNAVGAGAVYVFDKAGETGYRPPSCLPPTVGPSRFRPPPATSGLIRSD